MAPPMASARQDAAPSESPARKEPAGCQRLEGESSPGSQASVSRAIREGLANCLLQGFDKDDAIHDPEIQPEAANRISHWRVVPLHVGGLSAWESGLPEQFAPRYDR